MPLEKIDKVRQIEGMRDRHLTRFRFLERRLHDVQARRNDIILERARLLAEVREHGKIREFAATLGLSVQRLYQMIDQGRRQPRP
jgi:hypothetical protein